MLDASARIIFDHIEECPILKSVALNFEQKEKTFVRTFRMDKAFICLILYV